MSEKKGTKSALSQAFSELLSSVGAKPVAGETDLAKAEQRFVSADPKAKGIEDSIMVKDLNPKHQSETKDTADVRKEQGNQPAPATAPPQVPEAAVATKTQARAPEPAKRTPELKKPAGEKVTTIAAGTVIHGNMVIDGSAEVEGSLHGDIECSGFLTVSGEIIGCSKTADIDIVGARIEGNIESRGNVQIRDGAVVIGNVDGQSMQVYGALKGDILLPGHLKVGATALIMGDIQAGTIDIQNGAVIDGRVAVQAAEKADEIFAAKLGKRSSTGLEKQSAASK